MIFTGLTAIGSNYIWKKGRVRVTLLFEIILKQISKRRGSTIYALYSYQMVSLRGGGRTQGPTLLAEAQRPKSYTLTLGRQFNVVRTR